MTKKIHLRYLFLFILICPLIAMDSNYENTKKVEIRGVYGTPKPLWDKGYRLDELGINAVFTHSGSINHKMAKRVKAEGAKLFAEFATLNGKNYVDKHPEAWAINEKGEKVKPATWFMGVCPTNTNFRQYRFNQLKKLLSTYKLDGIFMDYVHWHAQFEDPEPILPETCFCDDCLNAFSKKTKLIIPEGLTSKKANWILSKYDKEWRNWRCDVIYDWAVEIKEIIEIESPNTLLGIYHCPWEDEEFEGARRRILGLDYGILQNVVDVFSPMVYHGRMERSPEWVAENIKWFSRQIEIDDKDTPKIWPIVQAYDEPHKINKKEFETVLLGGLSGQSSGVMMFTTSAVAQDKDKIEVLKRVYTDLMKNDSK